MNYSKFSVSTIHFELCPVQLSVTLVAGIEGFALLQGIAAVLMTIVDSIARFVSVQVTVTTSLN